MTNTNFEVGMAGRLLTQKAVDEGVRSPNGLFAYFVDNGWKYQLPSRPTLIRWLNDCGVECVEGKWMKV